MHDSTKYKVKLIHLQSDIKFIVKQITVLMLS